MPAIDLKASAVLIWLPRGKTPSDKDFDVKQSWMLERAVEQAYEPSKDHSKRPWIRSDGRIWGEQEIARAMSALRALKLAR
jgi:hypothetical protein